MGSQLTTDDIRQGNQLPNGRDTRNNDVSLFYDTVTGNLSQTPISRTFQVQDWIAKTYQKDPQLVFSPTDKSKIYRLNTYDNALGGQVSLPFNSTDFATELAADKWKLISGGGVSGELNTLLQWEFDTSTTDSDPGPNKFRFSSLFDFIYISNTPVNNGGDISARLASLVNGATISAINKNDQQYYALISVIGAIIDASTYFKIPIRIDDIDSNFLSGHIVAFDFMNSGIFGSSSVITDQQPLESLKFDNSYWPDETRQLDLSTGAKTLTLDTGVTNIVGNSNFFDVIADGINTINLGSGFKSNGVFPSDLNGKILDAGTYIFACIYSSNGIVVSVPALGGTAPEPSTPPTATNVYFTGQPVVGETMSGQYTFNAGSGGLPENGSTYKWYRATDQGGTGRAAIAGATFKNYVVAAGDENFYLQFEITPSDGTNTGDAAQSAWSRQVSLTDTFPPEIQIAIIEDSTPNILRLIFDENVTATNLGYTVKFDTVTQAINSLSGSGTNELLLMLNRFAQNGEVVTVDYDSVIGDTVDGNTNELVSFTNKAVVNDVQSSPISAIPYNSDLNAAYMYNLREVDGVSGNVTTINNPINSSLNLPCSLVDSRRPVVDDANKRLLMYDKEILDGAYNFSVDGIFTVVFLIEMRADDPNEQNRSLLYDGASRTLNIRTFTQGYLINNLKSINKADYGIHFNRHMITMVSDGIDVNVYLDEKTTPIFSQSVSLADLDITSILKTNTVLSKFEAFQEILFYNRNLSEAERLVVINDYLGNKYDVDVSDRPVITSFGMTNVLNGGSVNNGYLGEFSLTISDTRTIDRIVIIQTANAAFVYSNTSYLILEDGTSRQFNFNVPPFVAGGNTEMGIIVVDDKGRVSDTFIDTTINFTITDV